MAPTLYYLKASPAVRAVLMTAKTIGLEFDLKEVKLFEGEHLQPWYLKLNPQHTVPTLVDENGFTLWESHAIMPYIISKYGKDDSLYPKDPEKRALVDLRLYFDAGTVFPILYNTVVPAYRKLTDTVSEQSKEDINEIYRLMEVFLKERQWVAGDSVTIADFSLIANITSLNLLVKIDENKYPKIKAWLKRAEHLPIYNINKEGLAEHEKLLRNVFKDL